MEGVWSGRLKSRTFLTEIAYNLFVVRCVSLWILVAADLLVIVSKQNNHFNQIIILQNSLCSASLTLHSLLISL